MKRRKICVVTTSRADFGLLRPLLLAIRADSALRLQLIVSGMHLETKFGSTWREIEQDAGLEIDLRIALHLTGESGLGNTKSVGIGLRRFAAAFEELRPEILVLLGDRFELLAPAISALLMGIPIAHIHGGELSEGVIDDSIRHAITKFASVHFPATETYRCRIVQMGEAPDRVFNFGAPGLDQLYEAPLLTRPQLEREIGLSLREPVALVTYHPVIREGRTGQQIRALISAIQDSRLNAVLTMANADSQGACINRRFETVCARNPRRFKWIPHLGRRRYLSCLRYFTVMVGNSSSGLTEAPSFRLPVVNIGDRQRGRVKAPNVIDVPCSRAAILSGIQRAVSPRFRTALRGTGNPYDRFHDGRTSERIKDVLKALDLSGNFLKKSFHDYLCLESRMLPPLRVL